jgi:hypothetical protein
MHEPHTTQDTDDNTKHNRKRVNGSLLLLIPGRGECSIQQQQGDVAGVEEDGMKLQICCR